MNELGITTPIEKEERSFCVDFLQQLARDHKAAAADATNVLHFLHLYPAMRVILPPELNARAAFLELCVFYQPQVLFKGIGNVSLSFLIDEYDQFAEQVYSHGASQETELLHTLKSYDYFQNMLAEFGKQIDLAYNPQYGLSDTNWSTFADHIQAKYSSIAKQSILKQEPSTLSSASESVSSKSTAFVGFAGKEDHPASETSTNLPPTGSTSPVHTDNNTSTTASSDARQRAVSNPTPILHTNQKDTSPMLTTRKKHNPMLYIGIALGVCIVAIVVVLLSKGKTEGKTVYDKQTSDLATPTPTVTSSPATPKPTATSSPATPTPTAIPSIVTLSEFVGSRSAYGKIPFVSATASSELQYNGIMYWATNAIDGDITTSWQESVEGDGIGEYLIAYFDKEQDIDLIRLRLGYASYYDNNGRPKTLRFDFSDNSYAIYEFADINQDFYLRTEQSVHTNFIKLTILDAFTGAKCADTCITEVTAYQQGGGKADQLEPGHSALIGYVDISSVTGRYCVQCGSFSTNVSADYAENYARTMVEAENELGNTVNVFITTRNGYYAVCIGPFGSKEEAIHQRDLLATLGYSPIAALY